MPTQKETVRKALQDAPGWIDEFSACDDPGVAEKLLRMPRWCRKNFRIKIFGNYGTQRRRDMIRAERAFREEKKRGKK